MPNSLCSLLLVVVSAGCRASTSSTRDAALIVPGERVGEFEIGVDTQLSVLGDPSSTTRSEYAERGVYFSFDRGGPLTTVTVTSPEFATECGLRVGTPASDVESLFGTPKRREIRETHGKFVIPALVYDGIDFLLERDEVSAIVVRR